MRLGILWLRGTPVTDLGPVAAAQLTSLDVQDTPVSDLRPLAAATTLQRLNIAGTQVTDLSPIVGLPLTRLIFTPSRITVGMDQLRQMTTLRELDVQFEPDQRAPLTPREFWTRYDAGEFRATAESPQTEGP
jgi:Leucine-rich repeat (LRR) protein